MNKEQIQNELLTINFLHKEYSKIYKQFQTKRNTVEATLDKILKDTQKEFNLTGNIQCLLMSSSFESFHIYHIKHNNSLFVQVNNQWVCCNMLPADKLVHTHQLNQSIQIDPEFLTNFNAFTKTLKERTSLSITYSTYEIATPEKIELPSSIDDLKTIHENCTILDSGKKWYEGWDIPSLWAVVQTSDNQLYIYYNICGHSSTFDTVIKPNEATSPFLTFLESPGKYLTPDVLKLLTTK